MVWILEVKDKHRKYELQSREVKDVWMFWLINEENEGMTLSEKIVFDIFDKHFKKEF
jgi:hypothetical protein